MELLIKGSQYLFRALCLISCLRMYEYLSASSKKAQYFINRWPANTKRRLDISYISGDAVKSYFHIRQVFYSNYQTGNEAK